MFLLDMWRMACLRNFLKFQFQNSKSSNFRICFWMMKRKCCQCCVHAEADTKHDGARSHIWKGAHAALKTSISSYRKTLFPSTLINSRKRFSQIEIWENFANTPIKTYSKNNSKHFQQNKNTNPTFRTLLPYETLLLQSITKIQFKDREQPPVEMNYTDLGKVLSELFRPLVKNYLLLFLVVFSSFKVIPSLQKIDYQL